MSGPVWPRQPMDRQAIERAVALRAIGFVPEWDPGTTGPGRALRAVFADYIGTVLARLERAPEKNALAFLDLSGLSPAPAQSARAPMIFRMSKDAAVGAAPAGTMVSAPPPKGSSAPIMFETERAIGLMTARVAQVASLWPERDQYIDHTAELGENRPARLFARDLLQPIVHRLYLSHPTLLALSGNIDLRVEVRLSQTSAEHLSIDWEYWDGEVWRGFLDFADGEDGSVDGTSGLRRTGTVTLKASCARSAETTVNGIEGFWLRATLDEPLLPDEAAGTGPEWTALLPEIDTIRISTITVRSLDTALDILSHNGRPFANVAAMAALADMSGLTGRIVNEANEPLRGAVVTIHRAGETAALAVAEPSDADGSFGLALPELQDPAGCVVRVTYLDVSAEAPFPIAQQIRLRLVFRASGLLPDTAFADATKLDLTKPFLPFGAQPQPGSTFAFTSEELFAKPGATARLYLPRTTGPQDQPRPAGAESLPHLLAWEYWNGRAWAPLPTNAISAAGRGDFSATDIVDFTVPDDMEPTKLNDVEARWIRVRIVSGGYGYRQVITWPGATADSTPNRMAVTVVQPPALAGMGLGYTWQYGPFQPELTLTENDFTFVDRTDEIKWPGQRFQPFTPSADPSPALYIGFDAQPPADAISLFFDFAENRADTVGPPLDWEYWDGFGWRLLSTVDETGHFRVPGIVSFLGSPDAAALPRFGAALYWIRGRLQHSGEPGEPQLAAVHPNAVWASQRATLKDIALGTSAAVPGQSFTIAQVPVLDGEIVEVRESQGVRAATEWRIIALQLPGIDEAAIAVIEDLLNRAPADPDVVYGDLRLRCDGRRELSEVWVRWRCTATFATTGARDRVYLLDRAGGRMLFGNGTSGMIPPLGAAVVVRLMRSGGGARGNLPAGAISQMLAALAGVEAAYNLLPSEGGSDSETVAAFRRRGSARLQSRGRAVTSKAFEALAYESSAAIGYARAIPMRSAMGRTRPGHVTLVVIPNSQEPAPYPSRGLRDHVHRYISDRALASLANPERLLIIGPEYDFIDVRATLVPVSFPEAGAVEKAARAALLAFLHPLTGGPDGGGWEMGRGVHVSDVVAVLERVPGLDHVREIALARNGLPGGTSILVAVDRIVTAGTLTLSLRAEAA